MPPQRRYRKTSLDHIADALLYLEEAEKAVARVESEKLNPAGRAAIERLRASLLTSKRRCAQAIDAVVGRPRSDTATPSPRLPGEGVDSAAATP